MLMYGIATHPCAKLVKSCGSFLWLVFEVVLRGDTKVVLLACTGVVLRGNTKVVLLACTGVVLRGEVGIFFFTFFLHRPCAIGYPDPRSPVVGAALNQKKG